MAETKILKGLMQPMTDVNELWGTVATAMIMNGIDYCYDDDDGGGVSTIIMILMIMVMMGNSSDYYDDYRNGGDY